MTDEAIVTIALPGGASIRVCREAFANGMMKDVHRIEGYDDVLAVFRSPLDPQGQERLRALVDVHRQRVLDGPGGEVLESLYCWPRAIIDWNGKTALIVPGFESRFLFEHGSRDDDTFNIRGKEKQGKWFASARHRYTFLDPRERGTWPDYLRVCSSIAQAVRRLHASGLAHSDLSYRNVLVDPLSGGACVIDIDGLVVPGKYPPDVAGTPEFIAPEVVLTRELSMNDPDRFLPSIDTDRHALAVLIYLYLLGRHPLHGRKVHDCQDAERDDTLAMGERALWVEHTDDSSNRVDTGELRKDSLPWGDPTITPCSLAGPLLEPLFKRAFIDGLHHPSARPTAEEWERALVMTEDTLLPCTSDQCAMGAFVFDGSAAPRCPLCGSAAVTPVLVATLYSSRVAGSFRPDGYQIVTNATMALYPWHANRFVFPNERLSMAERDPVARLERDGDGWRITNLSLPDMFDVVQSSPIGPGQSFALEDDARILLSREDGGRLVHCRWV